MKRRIFGIEPGNDGNRIVSTMIERNAVGLGDWRLVASSEQGMLTQVARAVAGREWIVFLGWEPHPMNLRWHLAYLTGGDDWFGPNFGGAVVWTTVRRGYLEECANVGRLLRNLRFDLFTRNRFRQDLAQLRADPQADHALLARDDEHDGFCQLSVAKRKGLEYSVGEARQGFTV